MIDHHHEAKTPQLSLSYRPTAIVGETAPNDLEIYWNGLPIGRILKQPGVPSGRPNWFRGVAFPAGLSPPAIKATAATSRNATGASRSSGWEFLLAYPRPILQRREAFSRRPTSEPKNGEAGNKIPLWGRLTQPTII